MARKSARLVTVAFFSVFAACSGKSDPPVAQATALDPNVITGTVVRLDGSASNDPQGRELSFDWSFVSVPDGSAVTLVDADKMLPSFIADKPGDYVIRLVVSNGVANSPAATVTVHVTLCGLAPPAVSVASNTFTVTAKTAVHLSVNASDPDNKCLPANAQQTVTVEWMVISHPPGSGAIVSDPSAATPTFTPDVPGDYQLRVVATDSTSRKSPPAFVNVTANACAPIVAAFSTQSAIIGRTLTLTAPPVTDTCVPSASFTYQWTLITRPSRSEALLVAANTSAASFTPDVAGDYQAQLIVTDQAGFVSAPQTVVVHAAPCGAAAPALSNLAASPATPNIGDTTAFSVQVTDPNATTCSSAVPVTPFRYSWSLVSKPRGSAASLALQTSATPLLVPDVPGAYEVSVIVMDALGNSSDPAFLTIATTSCGFFAPTTAIVQTSPIPTNSNTPVALSAVATSSDNDAATCPARFRDTFTFTWSIVSAPGASRLSATSGASTSFTASSAGTYTVQAVATASNGTSSGPAFVTINVAACGSASPVIIATANAPAFPAPTQDVSLTAQASDTDTACGFPAPGFTWSIHSLPQGSATVLQNPGGAAHFVPDVQGTYVFRVVATDSTGLSSAPAFASVDVLNPNPDKSTITVLGGLSAATVVADDVNAGTITVTLRNGAGSPMAQLPVRITASGTGNTFNPGGAFASGSTDVNGVFTATMVSTKAELKTFTAVAGPSFMPVTLNSHPQLEYVAGPAARIVVTIGANPAATGVASSFTAIARDAFNNIATGYLGTATFTASDAQASFAATSHTFTAADHGVFSGAVTFKTVGAQTVTATDGSIRGTSAAVTVNAWFSTTNGGLHVRRLSADTSNAYAATSDGVYISTDHGGTWAAAVAQPADRSVEEIAGAPGSTLYAATTTGGVFVSTDHGWTWSAANGTSPTALPATNTLSIVADSTGATVYVGTTTGVFTTTDAGASWASTAFPTNNDPVTALAIDSAGTVYAATVTGNVYSTVASPVAWRLLTTLADEVDALAAPSTATVLAGTAKGTVFRSSDAGATWNTGVSAGAFPIRQIAVAGTTAYAASAGGGVFKTTDGGMTWSAVNTGVTELKVRGVAVDATTSTTVFAGTDGSGFIKTLTGGE